MPHRPRGPRRDRPRPLRRPPVGITRDGAWVEETADWADLEPGTLPSVRDDLPPFAWERLARLRRRLPAAARPVGRGRHAPGPAGDGRRPLRRRRRAGQRGRHGQAVHQDGLLGRRSAADPVRHDPPWEWNARARPRRGPHPRPRPAGVRQAGPRRLELRRHDGRDLGRARGRRDRRGRASSTPRSSSRRPRAASASSSAP